MPQADNVAWYHIDDYDDEDERELIGSRFDATVSRLENDQVGRFDDLLKYGSMYQNVDMKNMQAAATNQMPAQIINVSQAILDALVAKQVVNPSKATFDVDDGDWEAHVKAEQLDRFQFGECYRCGVYEKHEQGLRDAGWAGDGWIKYSRANRKIQVERASPLEMLLDPAACLAGEPRELYQVRYLSKSVAQRVFPAFAAQIAGLKTVEPPYPYPGNVDGEMVRLVEGWHLPDDESVTGPSKEKDLDGDEVNTSKRGAYVFACNHIVLHCKEWKRPRFPFVRMSYSKDIGGGYSIGLIQQLAPAQRELNKLKRRKLQGLNLYALPRVTQQKGSTITPDLNTDTGQIYYWTGSEPKP